MSEGTWSVISVKNYVRSGTYRTKFIARHPPIHGKYRCVYCGRKIVKEKMEVDHIIAINRVKRNWLYKLCVPHDINDDTNLVPSCHGCNRRKGDKGGLWAVRGKYWRVCLPIYTVLRLSALLMTIWTLTCLFQIGPAFEITSDFVGSFVRAFVRN